MPTTYPVHTVDDAYGACHPEDALAPDDPRYVDLTAVRGGESLVRTVARGIRNTPTPYFHLQLVSGHRGCGKSTELRQLQARLVQESFFSIYLDVEDALDLGEIKYQDVLIAIAKAVEENLRKAKIRLNHSLVNELERWFDERILTQEQKRDMEATLQIEGSVEGKVPLLARVLASIVGQFRSGSSQRQEIRHKLEQELSGFILLLNTFLGEARKGVIKKGRRDLVVLVDGLEKMQYREQLDGESTHSVLFVHHAEQLKVPECHLIYTIPIALAYRVNLGNTYSDGPFILPMVNYATAEGLARLREVVGKRLVITEVFESESALDRLIAMSGGSVRDLMRLIRLACDTAEDKITRQDAERAIQRLVIEFDRLLRKEDIGPLIEVVRERRISFGETSAHLLEQRLVHEFENGGRRAELHPAVRQSPLMQEALSREKL